jgi:P27 family predicted phage terminase small subunit
MSGPPPEHPRLRLLKGNPGKRPTRLTPEPARAQECPASPPHLNSYAKEEWGRVAPELHRLNLLTVLDVGPLAAYCSAAGRLREAEQALDDMRKRDPRGHALTITGSAGNQVTNPLLRISSQALADMQRIGTQFGLTPNSRLHLDGSSSPPMSKFEGLIK